MFAPLGHGHQPVDILLVGVRRRIVDKPLDFGRLGRQADQVQAQPPGQRVTIGRRRRRQALAASSLARMKRSIGVRTQASFFTAGGVGRTGAISDQCG